MEEKKKNISAVALMSSGLDSLIAAKIVKDQGIDVHGVCFTFQFDNLAKKQATGALEDLLRPHGIPLTVVDVSEEYLSILLDPDHGYGSGVNPCIDCHLFFLRKAKVMMESMGGQFLVTGEVVGQRPMSQTKPTLFHIDKVSGFKGLILRPLSAKIMPPTIPEEKGWVDRGKLYDISGRSRKRQFELVEEMGITEYNDPAGGCILTEPNYSRRVKAFFKHRGKDAVTVEELKLMRHGRHLWPRDGFQVIVGRDEPDNDALEEYRTGRWAFRAADTMKGPLVIVNGIQDDSDVEVAARITAKYTKRNSNTAMRIRFEGDGRDGIIDVVPVVEEDLAAWRV